MKLIGIASIIASLAIGYYFVIYLPQRDKAQQALLEAQQREKQAVLEQSQASQEAKKKTQQQDLQNCLYQADFDYLSYWARECKNFGIKNTGSNCTLPTFNAERVDQSNTDAKNYCFKEYPQN
jgi:Tfp pilus assembly protein PilE